jgi:hypothetical protein
VTDVAAGFLSFDRVNKPEVFALTAGHAVWAYVPNAEGGYHWNYLGAGFTAISATAQSVEALRHARRGRQGHQRQQRPGR